MRKASRELNEQREHNQTCLNYARGEQENYLISAAKIQKSFDTAMEYMQKI